VCRPRRRKTDRNFPRFVGSGHSHENEGVQKFPCLRVALDETIDVLEVSIPVKTPWCGKQRTEF